MRPNYQLQKSIANVSSLIRDVEVGGHVPRKFRDAPFTAELKAEYVVYLKRELARLNALKDGPAVKAVPVAKAAQ